MVNQCFVVTELLWAHLGSQLYPRLILKFSQRAQHPAQLNCSATAARLHAAQDERTSRRAGVWASSVISPAPQEKKKKSLPLKSHLPYFLAEQKKFFFSGKFDKTPLVFFRAAVLWNASELSFRELFLFFHFFFSLSQLRHTLQLLGLAVCLSEGE